MGSLAMLMSLPSHTKPGLRRLRRRMISHSRPSTRPSCARVTPCGQRHLIDEHREVQPPALCGRHGAGQRLARQQHAAVEQILPGIRAGLRLHLALCRAVGPDHVLRRGRSSMPSTGSAASYALYSGRLAIACNSCTVARAVT